MKWKSQGTNNNNTDLFFWKELLELINFSS